MPLIFKDHGVTLAYPENWTAETSESDDGWSLLLQSEGTAFLQLIGSYRPSDRGTGKTCEEYLDTAVNALRDDYPDLETEPVRERLAGRIAAGMDIRFVSLDLTASCWLRSVPLPDQTLLILCQTSDLELEAAEPVLRAMRASLKVIE